MFLDDVFDEFNDWHEIKLGRLGFDMGIPWAYPGHWMEISGNVGFLAHSGIHDLHFKEYTFVSLESLPF